MIIIKLADVHCSQDVIAFSEGVLSQRDDGEKFDCPCCLNGGAKLTLDALSL